MSRAIYRQSAWIQASWQDFSTCAKAALFASNPVMRSSFTENPATEISIPVLAIARFRSIGVNIVASQPQPAPAIRRLCGCCVKTKHRSVRKYAAGLHCPLRTGPFEAGVLAKLSWRGAKRKRNKASKFTEARKAVILKQGSQGCRYIPVP